MQRRKSRLGGVRKLKIPGTSTKFFEPSQVSESVFAHPKVVIRILVLQSRSTSNTTIESLARFNAITSIDLKFGD